MSVLKQYNMAQFQLRVAEKKQVKIRIGLSAASGFGKTYSALLLAYGITGDWSKIGVIDTENGSAELYSDLGPYNVLPLTAPFSPERYIEALHTCEKAEMEVIILDSISHEWEGPGGVIELVDQIGGGYSGGWKQMTPRHDKFKHEIVSSPCHIITTVRRKQDYILQDTTNKQGKTVQAPVKAGFKEITRDGWEYELTINLEIINDKHQARASKDRTGLFAGQPEFVITSETGRKILDWCNSGKALEAEGKPEPISEQQMNVLREMVKNAKTPKELLDIWNGHKQYKSSEEFKEMIAQRRDELEKAQPKNQNEPAAA